jgi:hypothetical protein
MRSKRKENSIMNLNENYVDPRNAERLLEKWGTILDYTSKSIKPIEDERIRLNTAIVLEQQERWCFNEANYSGGTSGAFSPAGTSDVGQYGGQVGNSYPGGDNYATGDSRLPKVLIPMIRRTFPELISNEIVGVQPMSGPVGLAFALRYKYNTEHLGDGIDGSSNTAGTHATHSNANTKELGYQFLDSRFTGTSSAALSGHANWSFRDQDRGVAEILKNFEVTGDIAQVDVSFEKTSVTAGTRRLGARWSVELEQDLKNMNGIDVDTEITNAMSYELQAEIDREMILRMIQTAFNGGRFSTWSPASADGRWLVERNRDLYQRLIIEGNRIAQRNRRGAANFVVATPRVCAIFEMLPEFQWVPVQGDVNTQPVGIAKVGSLGGRFSVYRDTRTEVQNTSEYGTQGYTVDGSAYTGDSIEYALLGYKGPEFYDTGIIYCPYVPVMVQRTIGPNDFAPRVGLLTRYGVVDNIFGADLYYHIIIINDLNVAFTPGSQSVYF